MQRVTWWVDAATIDIARRAAQADGRSVSAWVRRAIRTAAQRQGVVMYQIETRGTDGQWTNSIGDQNEFPTYDAAQAAIESLRQLGEDWAAAEYRIIQIV